MADFEPLDPDICRVCHSEALPEHPLIHPCICTGSMKWVHEDCLMQWLNRSKKVRCEICSHPFSFNIIYSPDMPARLPVSDLVGPILSSIMKSIKNLLQYIIFVVAWFFIAPLTTCRMYRAIISRQPNLILGLPFDLLTPQNLAPDYLQGCFVMICLLYAFFRVQWLRQQILFGVDDDWLEDDGPAHAFNNNIPEAAENMEVAGAEPQERDRAVGEVNRVQFLHLDASSPIYVKVCCIIALSTLFILIFACAPYGMGVVPLHLFNIRNIFSPSYFENFLISIVGCFTAGLGFTFSQQVAKVLGYYEAKRILGLVFMVIKASVLTMVEIVIFPLLIGWWLDICSLEMFGATLKDRESSFSAAPEISIFIHWVIGVIYVYYFVDFVLILIEIHRPGVFWFLPDFNNPELRQIEDIFHRPILEHVRKFSSVAAIFGNVVLLMLWVPIRFLKVLLPSFLPYNGSLSIETLIKELTIVLLFLLVILPELLQYIQVRIWLKGLVKKWSKFVAKILNIDSYLLGNDDEQPYERPWFFIAQLLGLLVFVCFSLVLFGFTAMTLPVWLGRGVLAVQTEVKIHEIYTATCGLFLCFLSVRVTTQVLSWLLMKRAAMMSRLKLWFKFGFKMVVGGTIFLGVIPLMFGVLIELMVIVPIRIPITKTPIFFIYNDWALGALYGHIVCKLTMMTGLNWFLRAAIERAYRDGVRNMDLNFLVKQLAAPVIIILGSAITIPFVLAYLIVPLFVSNFDMWNLITRLVYPFLFLFCVVVVLMLSLVRWFKRKYQEVKYNKYLLGVKLQEHGRMYLKVPVASGRVRH